MITDIFTRLLKTDEQKEVEEIVSLLKGSPQLEALHREGEDRRIVVQRERLCRLESLERERATTLPQLEAAVVEATQAEEVAQQALRVASEKKSNAVHARLSASLDFSFRVGVLEGEINNNAPTEIDAFIWEMHKADEKARCELRVEQRPGPQSPILGTIKEMIDESNRTAVDAHREYIKSAIADAEKMKRQALSCGEIVHRLDELKKGLLKFKLDRLERVKLPFPDVSELRRNN
jgi:hypothetical protein